ncbi:hypothetical protein LIER_11817 [Lithospermum erythrorhizon]|uniref:Uncharacterized protein n=1 Tax=Lithospermum erythrorhizon TaxID=34254 RepID=A0AAV3PQM7_LITER
MQPVYAPSLMILHLASYGNIIFNKALADKFSIDKQNAPHMTDKFSIDKQNAPHISGHYELLQQLKPSHKDQQLRQSELIDLHRQAS